MTDHLKYVGGGYFRARYVPKGQPAPVVHGEEVFHWAEHFEAAMDDPRFDEDTRWMIALAVADERSRGESR